MLKKISIESLLNIIPRSQVLLLKNILHPRCHLNESDLYTLHDFNGPFGLEQLQFL